MEFNDGKEREYYQHKSRIWDDFVQSRAVAQSSGDPLPDFPCNPHDSNKPMKRKQLKRTRILCPCVNMSCMMEGLDDGSSCPMKCRKIGEGGDTEI